jgi:uncharacterized low-complexity protein
VTETNDGRSRSSWRSAVHSCASPSGVLAGKNSNDQVGRDDASSSRTLRVTGTEGTCGTGRCRASVPAPGAEDTSESDPEEEPVSRQPHPLDRTRTTRWGDTGRVITGAAQRNPVVRALAPSLEAADLGRVRGAV